MFGFRACLLPVRLWVVCLLWVWCSDFGSLLLVWCSLLVGLLVVDFCLCFIIIVVLCCYVGLLVIARLCLVVLFCWVGSFYVIISYSVWRFAVFL